MFPRKEGLLLLFIPVLPLKKNVEVWMFEKKLKPCENQEKWNQHKLIKEYLQKVIFPWSLSNNMLVIEMEMEFNWKKSSFSLYKPGILFFAFLSSLHVKAEIVAEVALLLASK